MAEGSVARRRHRHVWVDGADHRLEAGLVLEWRRGVDTGVWEALVAYTGGRGSLLVQWRPVSALHPVADDGWAVQRDR